MRNPSHTEQLPEALLPTLTVCWSTLTDAETEDALDALQDWIGWLIDRYALDHRTIPPCWEQHGALVEELSALHTAWNAAFAVISPPGAPLEWHNQFDACRERLRAWISRTGCRRNDHRPDT